MLCYIILYPIMLSEETEDAIYLKARQKQQIYSCKAQIELLCEKEDTQYIYIYIYT